MYDIPFLDLPPLLSAGGRVRLPGSKSISNRVLLLAGLSAGRTRLLDVLDSDDTRVMLDALQALGCGVQRVDATTVDMTGLGDAPARMEADLFLGNAGTAMRPLAAALAIRSLGQAGVAYTLRGVPRMHERPIGDLVDGLLQLGCAVEYGAHPGYPPLRIRGTPEAPIAPAAPIRVRGDVSSQFLTALLLALPLLAAQRAVAVEVDGELISKPYVEITLQLLARFGVDVERDGWRRFTVPHGSRYRSPGELRVEGDASSASYFIAMGALAATRAPLLIEGVGEGSIQGDLRFVDAARAMGADLRLLPGRIEARRGSWPLKALTYDCIDIPDAAMTLAVMALFADGPTTLTGIASWRVKETDRIAAMAAELERLGARVETGEDRIRVEPPAVWKAAAIRTYDDHRIAMCFSLAAFNPLVAGNPSPVPVRILEPRCVGKTFPDYFESFLDCAATRPDWVPVIALDGPSASGKGTLAAALAQALGYHHLDSGALYRGVAWASLQAGVAHDDEAGLVRLAEALDIRFVSGEAHIGGQSVAEALRDEAVGARASQVSAWPGVRRVLLRRQIDSRRLPGLVCDGRDMGTVVFPDAPLKIFLTASVQTRAERRHKQLISNGIPAKLSALLADLQARDDRDRTRSASPLEPAEDALLLDNSALSIEESIERVLSWWQKRNPLG